MNTQEDDSLLFHGNRSRNRLLLYVGIGIFIAWNILLFILAVVAIAKANNVHSGSSSFTYAPISRPFTVGAGQEVKGTKTVSLLSGGRLRIGGGTSVYLSRGLQPEIPLNAENLVGTTFNPPASGNLASLSESELAFLAWTENGKVFGTLGKLSVNGLSLSAWSAPKVINGLTTSEAVIPLNRFTTGKKSFVLAGGGKLVVGVIENEATNDLQFTTSAEQNYPGSSNTLMSRLSDNAFSLAYFTIISVGNKAHLMQAMVGNVSFDGSGNFQSLKLTPAFNYSTTNGAYHTMFPLVNAATTATEFVIAYPSTSAILINSTQAPDDTLVVVKGRWNAEAGTVAFGPTTSLVGVKPNVMMTSTVLPSVANSPEKGVIVFINEHENNALTAVAVRKDPAAFTEHDKLALAATYKITDGVTDGKDFQMKNGKVIPFISANYIDDNSLAVSFSDFANLGKMTTTILTLNPHTLELQAPPSAAKYVTSNPNPNFASNYWWVVAAPLKFSTQVGYVVWQYLQTGEAATHVVKQTVVEVAPPPFGIVPDNVKSVSAGETATVVVSGVYSFNAGSPPFSESVGRYWYSDTLGELHERNGTEASIGYVDAGTVLLSLNSRIGLSISPRELLLIDEL